MYRYTKGTPFSVTSSPPPAWRCSAYARISGAHLSTLPWLPEYHRFVAAVVSGIFTSSWDSTNSPVFQSRVKPYTPDPTVSIITVEDEYSTYPAHASCSPVLRAFSTHFSSAVSASSSGSKTHSSAPGWYTPQMDPVGTAASMLLEPSMGSKETR